MQVISLFSGIGGFELAAENVGWRNIVSCEINEFGNKVLEYYWPNAYHHKDVHTLDLKTIKEKSNYDEEEATIIVGGFPCQPYSSAGKRKGKEDERHLWPEMLRVIQDVSPDWVVGENVRGIVNWSDGLVFDEVQADLEAAGYEVTAYILPACGVNAPHRRDRVWFVAHRNISRLQKKRPKQQAAGTKQHRELDSYAADTDSSTTGLPRTSGETESDWSKNNDEQSSRRKQTEQRIGRSDVLRADTDTNSQPKCEETKRGRQISSQERQTIRNEHKAMGRTEDALHPNSSELQEGGLYEERPQETERQVGSFDTRADWRAWENFPTQSPICSGDDGLSTKLDGITFPKWRNESIKAYGNAVVPQVVEQIFRAINEYESM